MTRTRIRPVTDGGLVKRRARSSPTIGTQAATTIDASRRCCPARGRARVAPSGRTRVRQGEPLPCRVSGFINRRNEARGTANFKILTASISFRARAEKRAEVVSAIEALTERMRRVAGCRQSRVLADVDDGSTFVLVSEWVDLRAVEAYFNSRDFRVFRGLSILFREEPYLVLDDICGRQTKVIGEP
jgi:quinol monooxygenase YgiN